MIRDILKSFLIRKIKIDEEINNVTLSTKGKMYDVDAVREMYIDQLKDESSYLSNIFDDLLEELLKNKA